MARKRVRCRAGPRPWLLLCLPPLLGAQRDPAALGGSSQPLLLILLMGRGQGAALCHSPSLPGSSPGTRGTFAPSLLWLLGGSAVG